jgi:hypothetical protein
MTPPDAEHQPTHRLVPRREPPYPLDELSIWEQIDEPIPPAEPPPPATPPDRKPTLDERFAMFLEEQPDVVFEFTELAREAKAAGRRKISAKMLIEVIRWGMFIEHDRTFSINNVVTSRLVRHVQRQHPELADLFETRELISERS